MVEQCAGGRGFKPVTPGALPVILPNALATLIMAALSALKIIPPLQRRQVLHTALLVRETLLELEQRQTLKPLFHNFWCMFQGKVFHVIKNEPSSNDLYDHRNQRKRLGAGCSEANPIINYFIITAMCRSCSIN